MDAQKEEASPVIKKFRIYTRTGDSGSSCLYTGERLRKDCAFFEAMGDVDELNSCIGIAREFVTSVSSTVAAQLEEIQSRLIDVGSAIATPASASQAGKVTRTRYSSEHTKTLEGWIDGLDDTLPPLRHFILPSGGQSAAFLHQARSVCRRAERSVVALARQGGWSVPEEEGPQGPAAPSAPEGGCTAEPSSTTVSQPGHASDLGVSLEGMGLLGAGAQGAESGKTTPATQAGSEAEGGAGQQGQGQGQIMDPAVPVFLNRLSDYLFTAARHMAWLQGRPEVTYQKAA